MAPTGRGGLRPYQPSKFQPFIIVCLIVTVIVVGFNFWNLMKKNSLLLVEIGKVQRDFKRLELEKKDCYVQFKDAEEKRKKHEDADHEKEILLEDTRRIVEDLKSEGDTLRQNITRLQSHIASAELLDSRKEKKSQSECEQKLEELRLQSGSSCDAEKEKLQQETTDQLNTMKKQLKLQYEKTQQLDQQLQQQQQQKQRATQDETKEVQPASNSPPADNAYAQQQSDTQKQQRQQKQQHEEQQRHEEQRLEQQWQEKQREEQREMQKNNQINGQVDQKLSSGQRIQRQGQQNGSLGDHRRQRNVPGNGAYRQIGKQSSGLRSKMSRRQVPVGRMDQRGRNPDPVVRQGEQQQGESRGQTEQDQNEEVRRVGDVQPPQIIKQEINGEQPGSMQVPGIGEQSQLGQPQGQRLLFKRSNQNATDLAASRGSELAADESTSQTSDQLKGNVPRSNNDAADDDTAKLNRGDADKDDHQGQTGDSERVNESASLKPPSDNKLIQNEQDHQDLRQDGQEKNRSPYHDPNSLDPEKAPKGNVEV